MVYNPTEITNIARGAIEKEGYGVSYDLDQAEVGRDAFRVSELDSGKILAQVVVTSYESSEDAAS